MTQEYLDMAEGDGLGGFVSRNGQYRTPLPEARPLVFEPDDQDGQRLDVLDLTNSVVDEVPTTAGRRAVPEPEDVAVVEPKDVHRRRTPGTPGRSWMTIPADVVGKLVQNDTVPNEGETRQPKAPEAYGNTDKSTNDAATGVDTMPREKTPKENPVESPVVPPVVERDLRDGPNFVPLEDIGKIAVFRTNNGHFLIPERTTVELPVVPERSSVWHPIKRWFHEPTVIAEAQNQRETAEEQLKIDNIFNYRATTHNKLARQDSLAHQVLSPDPTDPLSVVPRVNYLDMVPVVQQEVQLSIEEVLPTYTPDPVRFTLLSTASIDGPGSFSSAARGINDSSVALAEVHIPGSTPGTAYDADPHALFPNLVNKEINEIYQQLATDNTRRGVEAVIVPRPETEPKEKVVLDALATVGMTKETTLGGKVQIDGIAFTEAVETAKVALAQVSEIRKELEKQLKAPGVTQDQKNILIRNNMMKQLTVQRQSSAITGFQYLPKEVTRGIGGLVEVERAQSDGSTAVELLPAATDRGDTFKIAAVVQKEGKHYLIVADPSVQSSPGVVDVKVVTDPTTGFRKLERSGDAYWLMNAEAVQLHPNVAGRVIQNLQGEGHYVSPLQSRGVSSKVGERAELVFDPLKSIAWQLDPWHNGVSGATIDAAYNPDTPAFQINQPELATTGVMKAVGTGR